MSTESRIGSTVPNPFINAKIEIKIDELLSPETREILEADGSGVKVTISQKTLRRLQTAAWDATISVSLLNAEKAVLAVVEALGLAIRENDPEVEVDQEVRQQ